MKRIDTLSCRRSRAHVGCDRTVMPKSVRLKAGLGEPLCLPIAAPAFQQTGGTLKVVP